MDTGKSLMSFLAGALTGAVAAVLLAPDSGENTRAKIRQGMSDVKGKARDKMMLLLVAYPCQISP